jgi:hypothetical protein
MGDLLAGPYLAAAGLLVAAGLPKVRDPLPLVRALRAAGLPGHRTAVRAFAVGEVVLGVWALVSPGRVVAALVGAAYVVFSGFVALVLARGGILGSCGCFGKPDTPATRTHLLLTVAAAGAALAVAVDPPARPWAQADGATLATAGFAVVIGFLAWVVMAVLPTTTPAAVRSASRS